ncbi:MAG: hypothetical protein HC802_11345 [Caldilineaceae bacterium]|nr:hypothetical protein [Caldilineaceae bacterium]
MFRIYTTVRGDWTTAARTPRLLLKLSLSLLFALGTLYVINTNVNAQEIEANDLRRADISPHLERQLAQSDTPVSFLVILKDQPNVDDLLIGKGLNKENSKLKAEAIYAHLTEHALKSQSALQAWLDQEGVAYRPFYLVNMIEVIGDADLAEALRRRPEIDRLAGNPLIPQAAPIVAQTSPGQSPFVAAANSPTDVEVPYGIAYTNAPAVWAMGYSGEGIVVAGQDTGIEWNHPALVGSYRGWSPTTGASHPYNWYDAWANSGPANFCRQDAQTPAMTTATAPTQWAP